jgi:hypothetical protein
MNDSAWVGIRYVLIGLGSYFAGRGKIDPSQVAPMADQAINILSGGLYVRWQTRAVPEATAARKDVPTINPVTGSVIPGAKS